MNALKAQVARGTWCIACGHCTAVCPVSAITHEIASARPEPPALSSSALTPESLQLLMRARRSIRRYKPEPVSKDLLTQILNAGRYAPTGTNSQNVCYLVVTEPQQIVELRGRTLKFYERLFTKLDNPIIRKLLALALNRRSLNQLVDYIPKVKHARDLMIQGDDRLFYHAPTLIIVTADKADTCSAFNCAIALYNCSLMAHALGLGCCFNGFLENAINHGRTLKSWLGIPSDHKCFGAMTLGYPDVQYQRLVERVPNCVTWR